MNWIRVPILIGLGLCYFAEAAREWFAQEPPERQAKIVPPEENADKE